MKFKIFNYIGTLLFSIIAFGAANAQAQSLVWTDWKRLSIIEPTLPSFVWVSLENNETVSCGPVSNVRPFLAYSTVGGNGIPINNHGGFDRVYSTLLTALVSGREVRFRLKPSTDNTYCYVERIMIR